MATIDSYSETNYDVDTSLANDWNGNDSARGQSFKTPNDGKTYKLTSAKFYLCSYASTYNLTAHVYTHSGTYGVNGVPTGDPLASSAAVTSGLFANMTLVTFTFSGANQIYLTPNTAYCLIVRRNSADAAINTGADFSAPSHAGNSIGYAVGAWAGSASWDRCFYVYGDAYYVLAVTNVGSGTTNPAAGTNYYAVDTYAVVYAIPSPCYLLQKWTLDTVDKAASYRYTVTMSASHTLVATFSAVWATTSTKLFNDVKLMVKQFTKATNFNVTLSRLTLGSQDSDTGLYAKTYSDSTIEMVVLPRSEQATLTRLGLGLFCSLDAMGFTTSCVRIYDKITTGNYKKYVVRKVTPFAIEKTLYYLIVDLSEVTLQ